MSLGESEYGTMGCELMRGGWGGLKGLFSQLRDMLSRSGASKTTGRKGGVTIRAAQEGCP